MQECAGIQNAHVSMQMVTLKCRHAKAFIHLGTQLKTLQGSRTSNSENIPNVDVDYAAVLPSTEL